MPIARSLDAYRQSRGNLAVVVVLDSSQPEFPLLFETTFGALAHFGIPFRVADLARGPLTDDALRGCRAVLLPQEHLGGRLGATGQAVLLRAAEDGTGLVNLDADLAAYSAEWLRAAGIAGAGRGGEVVTGGTQTLGVRNTEHPVTWWQAGATRKPLKVPVPTALGRAVDASVLIEDGQGAPMLVARRFGAGKIVQWLASPKLWLRQYFGHTFGLDDVWVRGLTWAARKPFVMKAMPPFVRFRFDDCQGLWRDAKDLRFVDVLNEAGHVPNLSFCIRSLTADGAAKASALHAA